MSTEVAVAKAKFTPKTGPNQTSFEAHFNPVSLQYSVSNTLKEEGAGKTKKQYVTQGTGKLTMDLIFDNTADGQDVRLTTQKIAALMQPDPKSSGSKKQVPSIVLFEWGVYKFQGMMESYKETLDFFAPGGVPLRASVNITLVEQDKLFATGSADTSGDLSADAVDVPSGAGGDPSSVAAAGGDPSAARAIASLNGEASLRFSAGASLTVTGSVTLAPPAAFASAGAGIGLSAGAGIGISGGAGIGIGASAGAGIGFGAGASAGTGFGASAGFSAGASAGISASAGAGIGISGGAGSGMSGAAAGFSAGAGGASFSEGGAAFGSSASAGVTASQGAFAGLRAPATQPTITLDTSRFLPVSESVAVSTSAGSGFSAGGRAISTGTAGLSADVGSDVDLRARIQFEVE